MMAIKLLTPRAAASATLSILVLAASPAAAQVDVAERKCIQSIQRNAAKIAKTQGKEIYRCVKTAGRDASFSTETCIEADARGKVAAAANKFFAKIEKDCSETPTFGPDPAAATAIAEQMVSQPLSVVTAVSGDLDAVLVVDRDGAKCQQTVVKGLLKCHDTKLAEFGKCVKKGLAAGTIVDDATLMACVGQDPKGKIEKICNTKFSIAAEKRCGDLTHDALFPSCAGDDLSQCADRAARCEVCLGTTTFGASALDCDGFDDGEANGSCVAAGECPDQCGCSLVGDQCVCVRERKEITVMPADERARYFETFYDVYNHPDGVLKAYVDNHVMFFSRGLHNNGAFLPWHRGYILEVENRLQQEDCRVTVPYWNWRLHPEVATSTLFGNGIDQWSGDGHPSSRCVEHGWFGLNSDPSSPFAPFDSTHGQCLKRRLSGGSAATFVDVQRLFRRYPHASQYDAFRNRLEHGPGLHDTVHCLVGGTMCSARASNDPIFFSHHAHIDKIWHEWQGQSVAHRDAYAGTTPIGSLMPGSPYTPSQLLDSHNLPGTYGEYGECIVKVVYQDPLCGPGFACPAGLTCVTDPAFPNSCFPDAVCPDCTGICQPVDLPAGGCFVDADCGPTEWCRPGEAGVGQCAGFQDQDAPCNCDDELACTAPNAQALRCGSGLHCSGVGASLDAPGVCVVPCDESCIPSLGSYCAPGGTCRTIGSCRYDTDCTATNNSFDGRSDPANSFGRCLFGQCESVCGDPNLVDLAGADLGQCGEVLGWGRVEGVCAQILGCSARIEELGIELFATKGECEESVTLLGGPETWQPCSECTSLAYAGENPGTLVFGDVDAQFSDIESGLFVGGSAQLSNFTVGAGIPNTNGSSDHLVVGGVLSASQAQVYGGNIVFAGDPSGHSPCNVGDDAMSCELFDPEQCPNCIVKFDPTRYDFEAARVHFQALSDELAAKEANGTNQVVDGVLYLHGTSSLNRFVVPADQIGSANEDFAIAFDTPEDSYAIITVPDAITDTKVDWLAGECDLAGCEVVGELPPSKGAKLLWNFTAEGDISISGEFVGSILAPHASVAATEGTIEGQAVVERWAATAWSFVAGVPSCPEIRRR